MLSDALWRAWRASQSLAAYAVVVDAKDEKAKNFYLHFDFIPCQDNKMSLFLPMTSIAMLFKTEEANSLLLSAT
ncbi:hypothetical protein SCG7109_AV_00010 [Chlamydiales bacterium SCGC AG-110-M15]|nr:hypothetical protein SCG7109_AV_00010 [Chlamydiales bacterium SCGC AG-110-M15]